MREPHLHPDRLFDAQQAAELFALKKATIYAWASQRKLPAVKIGRALRFRESDLRRLIAAGLRPALRPLREAAPADADEGQR